MTENQEQIIIEETEIVEEVSLDDGQNDNDGDQEEKAARFKDGEILTFVRVRFAGNSKSFPFLLGKRRYAYGQKVMATSDRGMTVGYINSFPYEMPFDKSMLPLRSIARVASEEDIQEQKSYLKREKEAERLCVKLIERYQLDMNLTHVEFIQFGKKAVFYFIAPQRVDFRELVKEMVGELKMRIELRQISVRDRAAALGAIGACGLQTCCSSFLKNYGNVSIKMAKNQNLALIPTKINGVCGQIKCCIRYEDDVYSDKRNVLPREGEFIQTLNGDRGRVDRLHLLIEQFEMLTDKGVRRRYARNQFNQDIKLPETWSFPKEFEHITNELSTIVGITEEEALQAERFKEAYYGEDYQDDTEEEIVESESSNDSDVDGPSEEQENNEAPALAPQQPRRDFRPNPNHQQNRPRNPANNDGGGERPQNNNNRKRNKNRRNKRPFNKPNNES